MYYYKKKDMISIIVILKNELSHIRYFMLELKKLLTKTTKTMLFIFDNNI